MFVRIKFAELPICAPWLTDWTRPSPSEYKLKATGCFSIDIRFCCINRGVTSSPAGPIPDRERRIIAEQTENRTTKIPVLDLKTTKHETIKKTGVIMASIGDKKPKTKSIESAVANGFLYAATATRQMGIIERNPNAGF